FRDRTVAAPLKRGHIQRRAGRHAGGFRDRTVAAPLKQVGRVRIAEDLARFPRPDGRGPIEAFTATSYESALPGFPRPDGRGPIEAHPGLRAAGRAARVSATGRSRPH